MSDETTTTAAGELAAEMMADAATEPQELEVMERPEWPVLWKGSENHICKLTAEEREDRATAMAECEIEVRKLDDRIEALKRQQKSLRGEIAEYREQIETLSNAIHFRREPRDVLVVVFADQDAGEAVVWRPETREVLRRRPLTADERQQEFDLDDERREAEAAAEFANEGADDAAGQGGAES